MDDEIDELPEISEKEYETNSKLAPGLNTGITEIEKNYISVISDIPVYTREEEFECARLMAEGSSYAREEMICHNLRLVVYIAKQYSNKGVPLMDLIQEGNLGLIKAVDKFDYRTGNKFSSYAISWIVQSIRTAIYRRGLIHIPYKQIRKVVTDLNELGESNIYEETDRRKQSAAIAMAPIISLNQPVNRDDTNYNDPTQLIDIIAAEPENLFASADKEKVRNILKEGIKYVSPKERHIISLRYGMVDGFDRTLESIGKEFGLTRERIRQLEEHALRTMGEIVNREQVREYIYSSFSSVDDY